VGFRVDLYILGTGGNSVLEFPFYGPECHSFARTCHTCRSEQGLSQGLIQSKTLDCGGRRLLNERATRAPINLTSVRQSCFTFKAKP